MVDNETWNRARLGVKPDLIGMKAIASHLGVHRNTIARWLKEGLPIVTWGPGVPAAYADRLRVWATQRSPRRVRQTAEAAS